MRNKFLCYPKFFQRIPSFVGMKALTNFNNFVLVRTKCQCLLRILIQWRLNFVFRNWECPSFLRFSFPVNLTNRQMIYKSIRILSVNCLTNMVLLYNAATCNSSKGSFCGRIPSGILKMLEVSLKTAQNFPPPLISRR